MAAEDLALRFLESRNLVLERRNYRCRGGEIDLVMRDHDAWVFVEVRYRSNTAFGTPQDTVDHRKQRRLTVAALHFLARQPLEAACRFDVIAVSGAPPRIEWIRNAFEVSSWQ